MLEFIDGQVDTLTPTYAVLKANSLGYMVHISLQTYTALHDKKQAKLLIHEVIREDAHVLYGFYNTIERELFRLLLTVSGVGANTARLILSSLSIEELTQSIVSGNVGALKSVKGIGLKSAQRIIVDLKDKIDKTLKSGDILLAIDNTTKNEALSALVNLGFARAAVEKILTRIFTDQPDGSVEEVVKKALKLL
ncbi:MAG: Holliday junction branch migration protein RuvA [Bacteroidales bacterium]|nr:Holliday junction branch migration protein RuvA [Bacteroidales bacterium]